MDPTSFLRGCVAVGLEIMKLRAGLQFHRRKGEELVRRCELLMEYLNEVIESGPIQQTAAGALEQLQEHLIRAYEVLKKCGRGRVYRVINYRGIQDEIIDVNTSISACLGDYQFFNSIPQASQSHLKRLRADVRTYGALSVEEGVADGIPEAASKIEIEQPKAAVKTIEELSRQGVFSATELAAFRDEVSADKVERDQLFRLLGVMGEEQGMLAAQKVASEEEYLRQIAELISMMQLTESGLAPPERYLCPLTKDVMSDPVIVTSGRIYERSAIERWLKDNNTCPVNRVPIDATVLIRVLDLRAEIAEWLSSNTSASAPATASSTLQGPSGSYRRSSDEDKPSSKSERLVRDLDALDPLNKLETLKQLFGLAADETNRKAIVAVPGSLQKLMGLLENGSEGVQEYAVAVLSRLAIDANQRAILALPGSLQKLVGLLESRYESVQRCATGALSRLAIDEANQRAIGAVPGSLQKLVDLLESEALQQCALGLLAVLSCHNANRRAIAAVPGSLRKLVDLLESENEGVQRYAAQTIDNMALDWECKKAFGAMRLRSSMNKAMQDKR